jgi:hypothetical protein
MTGLLLLLEVTVCLTLCFYNCLLLGLKYARAKPPPVPWIYGRPYQFRGRTYTYERPRKRRFFSPHSGTTLQDLLRAEHHQRMRAIMRARGLLRESYRVRHKRRHKKRHHRARPRLFPGKTRGRQARTLEDKSIKLRHFSSHWTGSRLQRREDHACFLLVFEEEGAETAPPPVLVEGPAHEFIVVSCLYLIEYRSSNAIDTQR